MIVSPFKIVNEPQFIEIGEKKIQIKIVKTFKLLGVDIDSDLSFNEYAKNLCAKVNMKLFSIKKLFFLSYSVKIQFFKTFILPYFDYCSSLFIYFNKDVLQKISNCYHACIFKLFKFNFTDFNINDINNFLCTYGLFSFQHRLFFRLSTFIYNIKNNLFSPILLRDSLVLRSTDLPYRLDLESLNVQRTITKKFGDLMFGVFYPKFLN